MAKQEQKPGGAGKAAKNKKFKKRERKNVPYGLVYVQASFNNTIVTITDGQGNTLSWKSSGSLGFRGSRKGTPFAAQQAAMNAANQARDHGLRSVDVRVSGPGSGSRPRRPMRWDSCRCSRRRSIWPLRRRLPSVPRARDRRANRLR